MNIPLRDYPLKRIFFRHSSGSDQYITEAPNTGALRTMPLNVSSAFSASLQFRLGNEHWPNAASDGNLYGCGGVHSPDSQSVFTIRQG
jgi:hypothetical protein